MPVVRRLRFAILCAAAFSAPVWAAESGPLPAPALTTGDSWVFERTHEQGTAGFSRKRVDLSVERVDSDTMLIGIKNDGAVQPFEDHIVGKDWSQRLLVNGKETVTGRPFSFPMTVGASWTTDFTDPRPQGMRTSSHVHTDLKVVGWEDVTVPAGTFHALKIEGHGTIDNQVVIPATAAAAVVAAPGGSTSVAHIQAGRSGVAHVILYEAIYYAPQVKYFVKTVDEYYNASNVRTTRDTGELVSFTAGH